MAERIQRKRTKGWRKPAGAVYVGRPSKWGNHFIVGGRNWDPHSETWVDVQDRDIAVALYRRELVGLLQFRSFQYAITELRGKDLVCWCPLDQPCHADVLLELANAPGGDG